MKKYELLDKEIKFKEIEDVVFKQIRYLKDMPVHSIKKGDLGGYLENEKNLSQEGFCAVLDEAKVYEDGKVKDNALLKDKASVFGSGIVGTNAVVKDKSKILGTVSGFATILGNSHVEREAFVDSNAIVKSSYLGKGTQLYNFVKVTSSKLRGVKLKNNATIESSTLYGVKILIQKNAIVSMCSMEDMYDVLIGGNALVENTSFNGVGECIISGKAVVKGILSRHKIMGRDIIITGSSKLINSVSATPLFISGVGIVIEDFAEVDGSFHILDNVTLKDYAKIVNKKDEMTTISDQIIGGDSMIDFSQDK